MQRLHLSLYVPLLLLLTALIPPRIAAQESSSYGYPFLNLPATAQTLATGGLSLTYIDGSGNPGMAFDNPALFGEETAGRLFTSYFYYMQGMHAANALYGLPINERGAWAVGIRALNYGKIEGYDVYNRPTQNFSATDIALQGLFSYELTNRLRGALALKLIYSNIERYNAVAMAVDAGVSYYNGETGTSLGAAITNAGVTLKAFDANKPLTAWDLRLGYSQAFMHAPFRIHITAYGLNPIVLREPAGTQRRTIARVLRHFTFGAEYVLGRSFWIGVGYNPRKAQDLALTGGNLFSGLSAGLGFNQPHFRVAIAAARYHPAAMSFMVTFTTTFGDDRYIF